MDIQASKPPIETPLAKVGINELHVPIKYKRKKGNPIKLETVVSMYVSLTPEVKGINMSRLPRTLYQYINEDKDVSTDLMKDILRQFRKELGCEDAYLKFRFNYPIKKQSLITDASGWAYYPTEFEAKLVDSEVTYTMMVSILYSSTCPCSSHLSEMLAEGKVIRDGEEIAMSKLSTADQRRYMKEWQKHSVNPKAKCELSSSGAAHAQRSRADIKIRFLKENPVWIEDLVEAVEKTLKTPVQVIVKREDEQEFARLNATNLMFVEDAVRLMSDTVNKIDGVLDWSIVANHFESLHAHNAVCVNWKGVKNGLR